MEESYGYLSGTHARDKDAVVASLLICEMAAHYKAQGKTLADVMNSLYEKYGFYINSLLNFTFEGESGMEKMTSIMAQLRGNAPASVAGMEVLAVSDYKKSETLDTKSGAVSKINLPKSNVLAYSLPGGNSVIVRPSGTEPKLKIYVTACAAAAGEARKLSERIGADMETILGVK